jgi:metal-sulfur cluster biosynthetic enzyme
MHTDDDIREALRACFHSLPFNTPVDIVSLGLVESIHLEPDRDAPGAGIPGVPPRQSLTVTLIPPTQDEDANAILLAQTQNRLAGIPNLSRVNVHLVETPPWSPSRITREARLHLKLDPPAFPILNNRVRPPG